MSEDAGKRIGVLGGSFNPVHRGHVGIARELVAQGIVDEVWLMLSPLNPLKEHPEELVADEARWDMLKLATDGIEGVRACDIELQLPRPSYTINTLEELSRRYPEHRFRLVIGADNWAIFDRWRSHEEIAERYRPIIFPRRGVECSEAVEMPLFDVSSTAIRERIKKGEDVNDLLPPGVYEYIKERGLYGSGC